MCVVLELRKNRRITWQIDRPNKNDEICDGMTEGEKRAYQLGITNMYEMLKQIIEHDHNEGNYNVFVPEIKEEESGEYDLEDFIKWDSKNRE